MNTAVALPAPWLPRRVAALLEQGLVAGANFVAFVLFARELAPAAWGEFGFAYALVLFVQGFQRAWVTIPMITFSTVGWDAARSTWAQANSALALGGALLLLAAAAAALMLPLPWLRHALLMAACMALPMIVHEFARRAAVQEQRMDLLAAMGGVYAAVLLSAALVPAPAGQARVWLPALGVALGSAAAAGLYRAVARRSALPRPAWPAHNAERAGYSGWATLSHLGYSGYNFGVQALLAALAGPAAVGVFHACRMLVQPVSTLIGAMDSVDKPRAAAALAARGPAALRQVLWRTLRWLLLLALPYLALVALGAGPLLGLVYGERYAGHETVVWMWCLVTLCTLVSQPVESGLYVARRTRALFFGRAVAALVSLTLALPLVAAWGAAGALAAMAAGFGLAAACGALSLKRLSASS